MKASISAHQKSRGRPATGRDPSISVRLPAELLAKLDVQRGDATRSEAIRRLVEKGLA
ncbi:CopG family ribbon-helix-helix protein [Sphingosinicella microcystinivorans]|uniref:CopG family ribbon-helix-helix protein n=1 Tax=Sphingosinicella microcystinivorans TaxID=335406 RepID=UPI003B67D48D